MSRPNKHGVDKYGFIIEDGFFGDMDTSSCIDDTESGNFSKTELRYKAENLVEELREADNGSCFTVSKLLVDCGYDISEYSKKDIGILNDLLRKCKERLAGKEKHRKI